MYARLNFQSKIAMLLIPKDSCKKTAARQTSMPRGSVRAFLRIAGFAGGISVFDKDLAV